MASEKGCWGQKSYKLRCSDLQAQLETRVNEKLDQCLEIQGNSSDWKHSKRMVGLLMKNSSFLQKLNIWHVLCYLLLFMIECQVEKKRIKSLESLSWLWGAAGSTRGSQEDPRDKLEKL